MGKRKKARPNKPSKATATSPRREPQPSAARSQSAPVVLSASEAELLGQALDLLRTAQGKSGSVRIPDDNRAREDVATPRPAPGQEREHERDVDTSSDSTLLQALRSEKGLQLLTAVIGLGTAGVTAHTAAVQAKQAQPPVVQTRPAEARSPGQSQSLAGSGDPTQMSDAERLALFGRFVAESLSNDRSQIDRFQDTLVLVTHETLGSSARTFSPLKREAPKVDLDLDLDTSSYQEAQWPATNQLEGLIQNLWNYREERAAKNQELTRERAEKRRRRDLRRERERLLKQAEASEDAEASE